MKRLQKNFHTHTMYCGHSSASVLDMAKAASDEGYKTLAFTDHAPFPGTLFTKRMKYEQIPDYLRDVEEARGRYKGRMEILSGFEVEYLPQYRDFYENLREKVDFLILGQHFYSSFNYQIHLASMLEQEEYLAYVHSIVEAMDTGLFAIVAHPELFCVKDRVFTGLHTRCFETLCDASAKYSIPLELNAHVTKKNNGRITAATEAFFSYCTENVIIDADAHETDELRQSDPALQATLAFAEQKKLKLIKSMKL